MIITRDRFIRDVCRLLGKNVKCDVLMADYTSLKIGGKPYALCIVNKIEELVLLIKMLKRYKRKYVILGAGTNVLINDKSIKEVVIKLDGDFKKYKFSSSGLTAGAGVLLPKLISESVRRGISGFEQLAGIPGTVGGAVRMNAGTRLSEISKIVSSVTVLDGNLKKHIINKDKIQFGYRKSIFAKKNWIIVHVKFSFKKGKIKKLKETMQNILKMRLSTQPRGVHSAGCMFKNPKKNISAGKLIDSAGFKGFKIGNAQISPVHANFLINIGNAKFKEVIKLMKAVKSRIKDKFNIALTPEIIIWN